jgi:hypothetical protein
MKNFFNGAMRCNGNVIAKMQLFTIFIFVLLSGLIVTGCQKDTVTDPADVLPSATNHSAVTESNVLNEYSALSGQTLWELQQARAATARYLNIENAIRDGYSDINVVVQHMGHHYLKSSLLDATFDIKKPEILVYNKNEAGKFQLVAVEYAVPISLSATAPEGFTGTGDVWDRNTGFGLWLLHAWVWSYNPNGVFNPTNPLVHLH